MIEQATALGEPLEDPLLLYSVLYGVWVANYIAFNGDAMRELAAQFLVLAEKQGSVVPVVVAHRIMAVSLLCTGDILQARVHSDRAAALHNPAEHRPVAARFGQDNGVAILAYRSLGSWLLGYPAASLADVESAVKAAREIGQAATLMFVLTHTALTHLVSRNYAAAKGEAEELAAVAGDKGALFWKAIGTVAQGWVFALTGKASDAARPVDFRIRRFPVDRIHIVDTIAHVMPGDSSPGSRPVRRGLALHQRGDDGDRDHRGTMVRSRGPPGWRRDCNDVAGTGHGEGGNVFRPGRSAVARQQQAKSWELRAAMSMARLWRDQGKRQQGSRSSRPGLRLVH